MCLSFLAVFPARRTGVGPCVHCQSDPCASVLYFLHFVRSYHSLSCASTSLCAADCAWLVILHSSGASL